MLLSKATNLKGWRMVFNQQGKKILHGCTEHAKFIKQLHADIAYLGDSVF